MLTPLLIGLLSLLAEVPQCDAPHPDSGVVLCEKKVGHPLPHGARNPYAPEFDAWDEWW